MNTFFGVAIDCAAAAVANFWADVPERQTARHPTREHLATEGTGAEVCYRESDNFAT